MLLDPNNVDNLQFDFEIQDFQGCYGMSIHGD